MNALTDFASFKISDAMSAVRLTVSPTDKLDAVAKLFQAHEINSAPVVDAMDRCVGMITSHDLVRFQSELPSTNARVDQGLSYEITQRDSDGAIQVVSHPFDEVQRQMSPAVQSIDEDQSLLVAARMMCEQHLHHLVVLDHSERPVGILSSLDILSKLNE
jgi:CBS domain-containing protein